VDFGNILNQWEQDQKKKSPKPKIRNAQETREEREEVRPHPLAQWLGDHEIFDKDAEADSSPKGDPLRAAEKRRRLLAKRPDASIDLHGLTRDEAWAVLERFFETGLRQNFQKLEIVHGKGNHSQGEAVLKYTVREFIERCPYAGENGHGSATEGGTGVTWVLLK
jgi:DNA-nicking Smr family endonuclease